MNTVNVAKVPVNTTISDLEQEIETAIFAIQHANLDSREELRNSVLKLREMLFPVGYNVKVQLEEDGRKKRSTADASHWSFSAGEMVLFFDPAPELGETDSPLGPIAVLPHANSAATETSAQPEVSVSAAPSSTDVELEIQQCVKALEDVEKLGKQFIAFKWFRDLVLAGLSHKWASNAEDRQRVLAAAIDAGRISIQKIPNPRQPMFPTTTLSINRTARAPESKSRFNPVHVIGEPVSKTLLRDRG
jgi:ribonuclease HI